MNTAQTILFIIGLIIIALAAIRLLGEEKVERMILLIVLIISLIITYAAIAGGVFLK